MSRSSRSQEGYLMIDHRASPGISDEVMLKQGLPAGAGKGLFEAPTFTCSHCETVVVINPLRNRERTFCGKCDHYICDRCGAVMAETKECKTYKQIIEETQEAGYRLDMGITPLTLRKD